MPAGLSEVININLLAPKTNYTNRNYKSESSRKPTKDLLIIVFFYRILSRIEPSSASVIPDHVPTQENNAISKAGKPTVSGKARKSGNKRKTG